MFRYTVAVLAAVLTLALGTEARADRRHHVKKGQTLSQIAQKYRVSVDALLAANGLDRSDVLRPGDRLRVPARGVIYVKRGQSLSVIAKAHDVSVKALVRANDIRDKEVVRAGQRLVLPGHNGANRADRAARRWGRPDRPGVATLVTYNPKRKVRIRLLDRRGRPRLAAARRLAHLMRDPGSGRTRRPPRRLVYVLARISDHFGGRPIAIVSGFRPPGGYTKPTSRHVRGRALDLRVLGVSDRTVFRYCRKRHHTGCGYYPRSTFVHVDVRRDDDHWVDWSRPGQPPRYRPPGIGGGPGSTQGDDGGDGAEESAQASQKGNRPVAKAPDSAAPESPSGG